MELVCVAGTLPVVKRYPEYQVIAHSSSLFQLNLQVTSRLLTNILKSR